MTVLSNVETIFINVLHQGWSTLLSYDLLRDNASIGYIKMGKEIDAIKCTVAHGLSIPHSFPRIAFEAP